MSYYNNVNGLSTTYTILSLHLDQTFYQEVNMHYPRFILQMIFGFLILLPMAVSAQETPPQFWGDTTLWGKINALAGHQPPLIRIEGPGERLPQWEGMGDLKQFRVYPMAADGSDI